MLHSAAIARRSNADVHTLANKKTCGSQVYTIWPTMLPIGYTILRRPVTSPQMAGARVDTPRCS
jgi:hypothetical protein